MRSDDITQSKGRGGVQTKGLDLLAGNVTDKYTVTPEANRNYMGTGTKSAKAKKKKTYRVKTKSNRVSGMVGHKIGAKRAITVGVNTPNLQSPLLWNRLPVPLHGHSGFKHNIKILN